MRLVLASASPRRAELLRAAGIACDVHATHVDESFREGEAPDAYVRRVAEAKALACAIGQTGRPVLAADTVVVVDGEILGKPRDHADARRMLGRLSGRWHVVMTGVCLGGVGSEEWGVAGRKSNPGSFSTGVAVTRVEFAPLAEAEIEWYVASGEPMDKAGAYAIQGLASRWVTRIEGSYSNVVGLPVALVYQMCATAGLLIS